MVLFNYKRELKLKKSTTSLYEIHYYDSVFFRRLCYSYRETQHRSILSLSASYEEGCYDDLARDLDTQLAQVDMEDFRAEDILTTLPAMCCQGLQVPY